MQARLVEHGNGLVRGRRGAGVQRRTDGGCGQCLTRMAAQYESVSRIIRTYIKSLFLNI